MLKFATAQIIAASLGDQKRITRAAHRAVFQYEARPGYLYVRSRAISSRCNDNFDEFPSSEIEKAYRTFIGKPVFVNHVNDNHRRARGVIIDAALHQDRNPDGTPDTWAEVLMEIDAVRFPKLAKAILAGEVDRTSMGCDVERSVCSACGNEARTPAEYCSHIPHLKGKRIYRRTAGGKKVGELVRETCYGLRFFENSVLVEPPADPTAHFLGVDASGIGKAAAKTAEFNPADFDSDDLEEDDDEDIQPVTPPKLSQPAERPAPAAPRVPNEGTPGDRKRRQDAVTQTRPYSPTLKPSLNSLQTTASRKEAAHGFSWDEIGARHPHIYGDPEVHGEAAAGADGWGIGDAANHLAHSRPDDPDAEGHSVHDLTFHLQHVDPYTIDHKRHGGENDGRVRYAAEGYRTNPDQVPPLVLVHRHGVFQVADGHHRAEGAKAAGMKTVPAYVAKSPFPRTPSGYGDKAPYHGADTVRWNPPRAKKAPAAQPPVSGPQWEQQKLFGSRQALLIDATYINDDGTIRAHAYGEIKAPADVDTLREEDCPVCGDKDTFDGIQCQICGFINPPEQFRDPDLDKAKQLDLRKQIVDPTLIDNNGELQRVDQSGNAMPQGEEAVPGGEEQQLGPDGQPMGEGDPQMVDAEQLDENGLPPSPFGDQALDGTQRGGPAVSDRNGDGMIQPDEIDPDGNVNVQRGMADPEQGGQVGPRELPGWGKDRTGDPFTPGPDMPYRPDEPSNPNEKLDQDDAPYGMAPAPMLGQPGDGVADLFCPSCGFGADATPPQTQDMGNPGAAADGIVAGDVCPSCQRAQLLTPGEVNSNYSKAPAVEKPAWS